MSNLALGALAFGAAVAWAVAGARAADPYPPVPRLPPVAASPPPAERALPVLDAHCARCHQAERRQQAGQPGGDALAVPFANILRLDEIARDPGLIIPGRPDASPLYQRMLAGHEPLDVYGGAAGGKGPTAAEIGAVRDWIDALPQRACETPSMGSQAEASELMNRWLGGPDAKGTRFISLLHIRNACEPASTIAVARETVAKLLQAVAGKPDPVPIDTLGDESALLAIRLAEAGLTDEQWAGLVEGAPVFGGEAVPAEWLADRIIAGGTALDPATQNAARHLARFWQRDVDLARAAVELDLPGDALRERLLALDGDLLPSARRLLQGTLSRSRWEQLRAKLEGAPPPPRVKPAQDATKIDLALWSEKPAYAVGELLTVSVQPDRACHLTLVAVDPEGQALVIYPNEMEPENLIAPGVITRVPSPAAAYQLRLDRKGQESIVAVCRRTERHLDGLVINYERQRFPVLGDWRGFLLVAGEREAEIKREAEASQRSRRRRSGNGEATEKPPIDPTGPAIEGRAAITIPVD